MISIWYKRAGEKPEVIDRASNVRTAEYIAHEYKMAYGTLPGQPRHGKDKVWAGRKNEEPRE